MGEVQTDAIWATGYPNTSGDSTLVVTGNECLVHYNKTGLT